MSIKNIGLTLVGVAVAFTLMVAPASTQAQSIDDLNAMIAQLSAQLAALQGTSSSTSSSTSMSCPAPSLTIGSTGAGVTALQQILVSKGYLTMPVGVAMGYFGPLTQSAVMKWQAAMGVTPASGYYGPISSAACNATNTTTTTTTTTTTSGETCPNGNLLSNNCMPAQSGATCPNGNLLANNCMPGNTTGGSTGLSGSSGSIESFTAISGLSGEHVGEDEEDVEIAGIEIENDDGSDIELTAVRIDFSTQPGNDDLDEFITEVSVWLDGEEVARVDADGFNDDNEWTKTVSLNNGAIIRAGEKADLTVAVTGVSNIDSGDDGDDWALDFLSVRYRDAAGASITDSITYTPVTWDVEAFATASGVELKARLASDTPVEGVVLVDDTSDTDGVVLLRFTLEAENSDIEIKTLPITLATSTGSGTVDIDEIANTLRLVIDGEEFEETISTSGISASVTFDDIDFTIAKGDTVDVVVEADVNDTEGNFASGDKLTATFTASNRSVMDTEDQTGEALAHADKTGTATGEAQEFRTAGVALSLVSAVANPSAEAAAPANFTLRFKVTAVGDTVYVSSLTDVTASGVTAGKTSMKFDKAGTATTTGVAVALSNLTDTTLNSAGLFEIEEDTSHTFEITGSAIAQGGASSLFKMVLNGLSWSTSSTDSSPDNAYTSNLDAFQTPNVSVF